MTALILSLLISATALADDTEPPDEASAEDSPAEPAPPQPPAPPDGVNQPLSPIDESKKKPRNPQGQHGPPGEGKGHGPPGEAKGQGQGPPGAGGLTAERLKALRAYKHQSLDIRQETEVHGGGYSSHTSMHMGYSTGPMVVTQHVNPNPIYTTRSWGIYRGPERITVPEFLRTIGDGEGLEELRTDISGHRQRAKRAFNVAGLGGAGLVVGILGMSVATTESSWYTWNLVALGGSVTGLSGMIGGSLAASKASQLERHPRTSMSLEETQKRIDIYNDSLRVQLDLSPKEVWLMEMGED